MATPSHFKNRTYYAWASMKTRCHNPNNSRWEHYGGRGIKVCSRWQKYENFLKDMGYKPDGTSLGRIDNDKGYGPENCRWETALEQMNNTSRNNFVEYNGIKQTLTNWAREFNLKSSTVRQRFYVYHWDIKDCLTKPVGNRG